MQSPPEHDYSLFEWTPEEKTSNQHVVTSREPPPVEMKRDQPKPPSNIKPKEKVVQPKSLNPVDSFDDMGLPDQLLRGVYAYGFERPSQCQQKAALPIIAGKDIVIQAQTGTGKTAAYAVPALARVSVKSKTTQLLILCHNRELAGQVHRVVASLSDFLEITVKLLVGGTSVSADVRQLQSGAHVVVGVTGRVLDMINRKTLNLDKLKTLVLDDGEQLLSRSGKDQVYKIFQNCPKDVQSIVACVHSEDILETCSKFLIDPVKILVPTNEIPLDGIRNYVVDVEKEEWKFSTLVDLLNSLKVIQCMVFVNTSRKVDWLTEKITAAGLTVSCLHGDLQQSEREQILRDFRSGNCRVLICTDALSHGIDVLATSTVVQYDLSRNREEFIHRAGRSGRFGRKGLNILFQTNEDRDVVKELESHYSITIPPMPDTAELLSMV